MIDEHRDEVAKIIETVARDGLPGPRDLDVALDAIDAALDDINRFAPMAESMDNQELSTVLRNYAKRYPDQPLGALLKAAADRVLQAN